ncbi:MAG: type III pantothenate kinase [Candidatus Omnitrophota bacterium]|jgi:type III pantothenate kinase
MKNMKPLFAFDIGNSNITAGVFFGERLLRRVNIPTARAENCGASLRNIGIKDAGDVVICSVVPAATRSFCRCLKLFSLFRPMVVGSNGVIVPLKNLYTRPKETGQDRLVNAYAAVKLFGAPLICVDLGTAVTFDAVSARGEYLGGMIFPGMGMQLRALCEGTALLPKVKLRVPSGLLGKRTQDGILNGVVRGTAAVCDGLCDGMKKQLGGKAVVIGTGGDIRFISRYTRVFDRIEPDLTLRGLRMVYEHYNNKAGLSNGD